MRILFCLLAVALTGCGVDWNNPRPPTTKMELSLDAVKLIASDIGDPHDVRTFQQADYELHAQRNLLLRYEKLSEEYRSISTDDGKMVLLQVTVLGVPQTGRSPLEVCPLTRNWTMHATWKLAHPFGPKGVWAQPGGDVAGSGCVGGEQRGQVVTFNVTRWYIDYARARRENLGLLLRTPSPIRIAGDKSGEGAPRLFFDKFVRP